MFSSHVPNGMAPVHNSTLIRHVLQARENVTPNQFRESSSGSSGMVAADYVETNTIIAACVMFIAILIAWNLPILRDVIAGLKVRALYHYL